MIWSEFHSSEEAAIWIAIRKDMNRWSRNEVNIHFSSLEELITTNIFEIPLVGNITKSAVSLVYYRALYCSGGVFHEPSLKLPPFKKRPSVWHRCDTYAYVRSGLMSNRCQSKGICSSWYLMNTKQCILYKCLFKPSVLQQINWSLIYLRFESLITCDSCLMIKICTHHKVPIVFVLSIHSYFFYGFAVQIICRHDIW